MASCTAVMPENGHSVALLSFAQTRPESPAPPPLAVHIVSFTLPEAVSATAARFNAVSLSGHAIVVQKLIWSAEETDTSRFVLSHDEHVSKSLREGGGEEAFVSHLKYGARRQDEKRDAAPLRDRPRRDLRADERGALPVRRVRLRRRRRSDGAPDKSCKANYLHRQVKPRW